MGAERRELILASSGLHAFQKAAAAGTLPMVSYIVGPAALSEHP